MPASVAGELLRSSLTFRLIISFVGFAVNIKNADFSHSAKCIRESNLHYSS